MPTSLPIDQFLPEILARLEDKGALVLVAEPGAGKTTRVPAALLRSGGEVLVLEPRRVAARLAALRVAEEQGEELGGTVGYQVRFESRVSSATRLRFMTEGILQRRLQGDPQLQGVHTVVLDELHERSLQTDLSLALLVRLRATTRPDLRLVAMSATLDAEPVAVMIGGSVLRVPGRLHPVELEYLPDTRRGDVPLTKRVVGALGRLIDRWPAGDVLVFLPGIGEIRRCQEAAAELARSQELELCPLHGSMSLEEQARALRPGRVRKVILCTNIAESSLTVEGVSAVIDGGLARSAAVLPGSGLPTLVTAPISKASADQRAGRAGRMCPGLCVRLYSEADYHGRHAHDAPELLRTDLAAPLLAAAALGWRFRELDWLDAPPEGALAAAERLLVRLGALDLEGTITGTGREMARLPLDPRLARFVVEGARRGVAEPACHLAATITDGDRGSRDVADLVDAVLVGGRGARTRGADRADRSRRQLLELLEARRDRSARANVTSRDEIAQGLRLALLAGHPDRVAERRSAGQLLLAGGGSAQLAGGGHGLDGRHFLILDAHGAGSYGGRPASATVTGVTTIEPDWLLDLHADWIEERQLVTWNDQASRVESREQLTFGSLVLDESTDQRPRGEAVSRLLFEKAMAAGLDRFADASSVEGLLARVAFVSSLDDSVPAPDEDATRAALTVLCRNRSSFSQLAKASLLDEVRASLELARPGATAILQRLAPEHVTLASGRRLRVEYDRNRSPLVKSMLQDFFGSTEGPSVGGGRVPLVLHLLAPNRRPLQITTDLAGFWERHYPSVRRELRQRYSRHDWPEDPRTAKPPPPRRRGRRR